VTQPYNLRNIRRLLIEAFNLEELRRLCFEVPEFRPVYDNYSEGRKDELVRHLIEHCDRKSYFALLLSIIEEDVPDTFAKYAGVLGGDGASLPRPSAETGPPVDLAAEKRAQLTTLIAEKERRLFQLQLRAARSGISTPPEVALEIDDLEKEINRLKQSLFEL
jgi:hypothetical protein